MTHNNQKTKDSEEVIIIKQCQQDNPSAQKELYETYLPYVLTIVNRFGILHQDVADVIQEIFIEIFFSIRKYKVQKGEFKYWLKSIAIHKILKIQRKQKRFKETFIYETEKIAIAKTEDVEEEVDFLDKELPVQLIRTLPDGYRTVLNLYMVDGFSHKEISKHLGINEATSRSQLTRAKKLLRKKLLGITKENRYGLI